MTSNSCSKGSLRIEVYDDVVVPSQRKVETASVQSNFFCKKIQLFANKIQHFCKIFRAFQCFSVQFRARLNAVSRV